MRKILIGLVASSFILVACSKDEETSKPKEDTLPVAQQQTEATDSNVAEGNTAINTQPINEIQTQEEKIETVDQSLSKLETESKEKGIIEDVIIDEKRKEVNVKIIFTNKAKDEDIGAMALNYESQMMYAYPDKKINVEIEKK